MSPSDDVPPALPTDTRPALARDLQPIAEQLAAIRDALQSLSNAVDSLRRMMRDEQQPDDYDPSRDM